MSDPLLLCAKIFRLVSWIIAIIHEYADEAAGIAIGQAGTSDRIEPSTFRFSGGYACDLKPLVLVRALQNGRIGGLGAPVLKVWPDIGRMKRGVFDLPPRGGALPQKH